MDLPEIYYELHRIERMTYYGAGLDKVREEIVKLAEQVFKTWRDNDSDTTSVSA